MERDNERGTDCTLLARCGLKAWAGGSRYAPGRGWPRSVGELSIRMRFGRLALSSSSDTGSNGEARRLRLPLESSNSSLPANQDNGAVTRLLRVFNNDEFERDSCCFF